MESVPKVWLNRAVTCRETAHMCAGGLDSHLTEEAEDFAVVVFAIRVPADKRSDSVHSHREVQTRSVRVCVFASRFQVFQVHDAIFFRGKGRARGAG